MNSIVVAGVLKRIYNKFDMKTFSNRLRLQKVIYLLQEIGGINLGYSFSWYIYGPYSIELTRDAFQIDNFSQAPEIDFNNVNMKEKFDLFLEKINNYKENDFWLEIASSIHLLIKTYPSKTKSEIVKIVQNKSGNFKRKKRQINQIFDEIQGWLR